MLSITNDTTSNSLKHFRKRNEEKKKVTLTGRTLQPVMHVLLLNKRNWNSELEWTRATQAHCWVHHRGDVTHFHSFNLILHPHFNALCRKYAWRAISSCHGERRWPATSTENMQRWDQIRGPHRERSTSFAAQMTSGQLTAEALWV